MESKNPSGEDNPLAGNQKISKIPSPITAAKRIAFMAGNADFRAARTRCALACEDYNKLREDAPVEDRVKSWLRIVDPYDDTSKGVDSVSAVAFSDMFQGCPNSLGVAPNTDDNELPITPTMTTAHAPAPRPSVPFIKTPVHMDYGLRVRIAPTTFINRNCNILDTPVADVVIGERCSIGPGVTIISVGHPVKFEERCESVSGKAGSWGAKVVIEDGVWIGAGVTILPGVTIGSYSTIGAGSLVNTDIPSRCVAVGNPATIRFYLDDKKTPTAFEETAYTLEDALRAGYSEGD